MSKTYSFLANSSDVNLKALFELAQSSVSVTASEIVQRFFERAGTTDDVSNQDSPDRSDNYTVYYSVEDLSEAPPLNQFDEDTCFSLCELIEVFNTVCRNKAVNRSRIFSFCVQAEDLFHLFHFYFDQGMWHFLMGGKDSLPEGRSDFSLVRRLPQFRIVPALPGGSSLNAEGVWSAFQEMNIRVDSSLECFQETITATSNEIVVSDPEFLDELPIAGDDPPVAAESDRFSLGQVFGLVAFFVYEQRGGDQSLDTVLLSFLVWEADECSHFFLVSRDGSWVLTLDPDEFLDLGLSCQFFTQGQYVEPESPF